MDFLRDIFKDHWNKDSFFLLAGPCVVEEENLTMEIAGKLQEVCQELKIPFCFKASYRKANRSRGDSFRGIGDEKALEILQKVKKEFALPVITDIHNKEEVENVAVVADILQIPAFLCRQSDLIETAARSGRAVNIKKGQFLSPDAMRFAIEKVTDTGNEKVFITERGTTFGYTDLVVDFRSIPMMKKLNKPVIVDCTHSLQMPNQQKGVTGGVPEFISTIAKCAVVSGADGLFIETHPQPAQAKSDGANMLNMNDIKPLLYQLKAIRSVL